MTNGLGTAAGGLAGAALGLTIGLASIALIAQGVGGVVRTNRPNTRQIKRRLKKKR